MKKSSKSLTLAALLLSWQAFAGSQAYAQSGTDFYKSKRIFVVCSSAPGGGYDQYARLFARHIGKHIPGEPTVVVQNMPGAEGIKAANYIYNVAPQDGTFIGALPRSIGLSKIYSVHEQSLKFDPLKFKWIGSLKRDIGVLVVNTKSGINKPDDLKTHEVTVSSQAINSPNSIYARMLNQLYGSKIKPVEGYEGSTAGMLAVERFETDGHITGGTPTPVKNRILDWAKESKAKVVLQFGMHRDPDFPDAPTALELISDPKGHQLFQIAFTEQEVGSPFVFGPNVPKEQYEILLKAFKETYTDPEFIADAEREKAAIYALNASDIITLFEEAYASPPAVLEELRHLAGH